MVGVGNALLIRADSNSQIGIGHVMRSLALAQAWQHSEGSVLFACADLTSALENRLAAEGISVHRLSNIPGSAEDAAQTAALAGQHGAAWIVVDGYHFGARFQQLVRDAGVRVLMVDDYGHAEHYYADLVLNQNLAANEELYSNRESYTRLLLGTRYALLRRQFLAYSNRHRDIAPVARKVLVTLGGGDPDNVTGKVIEALCGLDVEAKIVVGGSNPHADKLKADRSKLKAAHVLVDANNMPELMAWADVAIAAAGMTSWELAFMGLPSLMIVLADNQVAIAAALEREGVSVNLGAHTEVSSAKIAGVLQTLLADSSLRKAMSERGRALVDGEGASRVVSQLRATPLRITFISDEGSWLNAHLSEFVAALREGGYQVRWVHKPSDIGEGDVCFLLSFGQLVPGEVLKRHRHNLVVHESDLPKGRGWSPLTWQILEGKNDIPVTLFEATELLDSGPIYAQTTLHLAGTELVDELRSAQARATVELCRAFIADYPESAKRARPQVGEPSYYPRRGPADSQLDPNKTLAAQFNLLRVVDNDRYPAFFEHKGQRYVLKVEKQT
jgi:UDP-2,4-diacetamido-2,4,6-trideoxy-beta-L-altropyranose hydrolase